MSVTIGKIPIFPPNKIKWANSIYAYLLICFLSVTLSGCITLSDPEASQIHNKEIVGTITSSQSVGQSFISRRENMNSLVLWLKPKSTNGTLIFELFTTPNDNDPLLRRNIHLSTIPPNGRMVVPLTQLANPSKQHFYIRLSTDGDEIEVLGRNEDAYQKGSAYINNQPIDSDISFNSSYDYTLKQIIQDVLGARKFIGTIPSFFMLLFLPGWILLKFTGADKNIGPDEIIPLSIGLSLSIVPLLMLWTSTLGLKWNTASVWIVGGIGLLFFVGTLIRWIILKIKSGGLFKGEWLSSINLYIVIIFACALFVRLAMVRDLAAPPWVDSVHHGLITRLILENGAYPNTYAPYLPQEAIHYHNGYHSILATFIWLSGLNIPDAMLLFGQVLNALSIFAVYLLTTTLTDNRYAGIFASMITAFLTPMPTYLTSWGRYTHLTGLLILPTSLRFIQHAHIKKKPKSLYLLSILAIAGLSLVHYRVLIFGVILLLTLSFKFPKPDLKQTLNKLLVSYGRLFYIGFGALLLALPWWLPRLQNLLIPTLRSWEGTYVPAFNDFAWSYLNTAFGIEAMWLAVIGVLIGMFQRKKFSYAIVLWIGLMFVFANFAALRIPIPTYINNTSVEISLFMPISVLGGYALSQVLCTMEKYIPRKWYTSLRRGLIFGAFIFLMFAIKQLLPILNPVTFLFRISDHEAITWVEKNLPLQETILINPTEWGYGLYMGNDGGYWISALAGQRTMPPPVLYGFGKPEYIEGVNQIVQNILLNKYDIPTLWHLLQSEDIKYVFLGARGGPFSAKSLSISEYFKTVYNKNGVHIFEVRDIQNLSLSYLPVQ
ncbi:MAG: hypothetical protein PVG14_04115 [Anaerolineales bacterium]|jgi:hypothetical protein